MFNDTYKERYTTIPFAIDKTYCETGIREVLSHQHREIELIAIEEGSADFFIDSVHFHIVKGDILVIPPYAIHRVRTTAGTVTSYYCICFDLQLLCDRELGTGLDDGTLKPKQLIHGTETYAEYAFGRVVEAFSACEKNHVGWELEAIGNMSLFFGTLKSNGCFTPDTHSKTEKNFGKHVMEYITAHYSEQVTSYTAARALFMNNSYFCRLFKKNFGCCFSEYILAYRLEKARIFLKNADISISDISFRLGFNSCSYFGKCFRDKYGISPSGYRSSSYNEIPAAKILPRTIR